MRYFFILMISICTTVVLWAGGKEAYRNYFLGSYYYAEAQYIRAENHLQRAFKMEPEQYVFALAYALAQGRLEKTDQALATLQYARTLLSQQHPDYQHLLSLQSFVAGMIQLYGGRYREAVRPLRRAVFWQNQLTYPEERSIMLNALGYVQIMNQAASGHQRQNNHQHVHPRDMERGLQYFRSAYRSDVQNTAAASNYQILLDSLNLPTEFIVEDKVERDEEQQLNTNAYSYLPANMQPLLEFLDYEEVIFLLDISGSMVMEDVTCLATDRFKVMKETALLMLEHFADSTVVGIGTIGGDCGTVPRLWYPGDSLNRKDLRYALEFLVPDGTTPLLTILQQTPELFTTGADSEKAIVFISDGENICRQPGVDICEWSEQLRAQQITINIMTFLGTSIDNANAFAEYTCLAENTFGQVMYLDGNRCRLEHYKFDLVKACQLEIPELQRVECGGPGIERLWAIFPE